MRPIIILLLLVVSASLFAQKATIRTDKMVMTTYDFSEPDPVPRMGNIYPYFGFDGYSDKAVEKEWNMVVLENDYIKVLVAPEIGGKVWGAIEKSTGQEFLYYNKVVKFRDIAMRGPWTSGGLEYNFGDIGHIPTGATPVDYVLKENEDGSVSCVVGALDLPSRTKWNVEIRLPADKAYLETAITWENKSPLPVTYYHWMNAAAKARGNLQFIYPGSARIGHGGEIGGFPMDNGIDISYYENNNFGPYKSYHVLNAYSNFFGGYWHDDNFGFGHLTDYDEKPGKKIWIWGLSDQGMIWEDLLTDSDGQYVEYQSGKLFNQAAQGSTKTPFKHREFSPYDSDHMTDVWFPIKETGGMVAASEFAVLNVEREDNQLDVNLSPLQAIDQSLTISSDGKEIFSTKLELSPLELYSKKIPLPADQDYTIELGERLLYYSSNPKDQIVDRPLEPNPDFDWGSAFGLYTQGLEQEKQRDYNGAHSSYKKSLQKEPGFSPAINRLALSQYRRMEYDQALKTIQRSLAIDTYDPEANYFYALINQKLDQITNAKSGFSIAAQGAKYRSPSYVALAKIFYKEGDYRKAKSYVNKALQFNTNNTSALELKTILHRNADEAEQAHLTIKDLLSIDPTNALAASEKNHIWGDGNLHGLITNELPHESYLELAMKYLELNEVQSAIDVLKQSPANGMVSLWLAYLGDPATNLESALGSSPHLVFPHRTESLIMLETLMNYSKDWKLRYYAGLIYWYKGRIEKAKELFNEAGYTPDFAPFYLAKAKLTGARRLVFKAQELAPEDWRIAYAVAQLHFDEGRYAESNELTARFLDSPTGIGMLHAKSLIALRKYKQAVSFLEDFNVLPFEGANEGRVLYHQATIMASLEAYSEGRYRLALQYAKKSNLWPRNLGAGKPYDVDERLNHYLIARCYEKIRRLKDANTHYEKIIAHRPNQFMKESVYLIFQALALRNHGKLQEAHELVINRISESPDPKALQWVADTFLKYSSSPISENDSRVLELAKTAFEVLKH